MYEEFLSKVSILGKYSNENFVMRMIFICHINLA